jgi:hypothetical protein
MGMQLDRATDMQNGRRSHVVISDSMDRTAFRQELFPLCGWISIAKLAFMRRASVLAILIPLSAISAQTEQEAKTAYLEQCALSIRLTSDIQPIEIQPDSFLGFDEKKHQFFAILCKPNNYRTFHPPDELTVPVEQISLSVHDGLSARSLAFPAIRYHRENHPLRGIHSFNMMMASRDRIFHIMLYSDPERMRQLRRLQRPQKKTESPEEIVERNKRFEQDLHAFLPLILLEESNSPAITEEEYHTRLIILVSGVIIVPLLLLLTFFVGRIRKNKPTEKGRRTDADRPVD